MRTGIVDCGASVTPAESFDNTDAVDTLGVDSVGVRADYALLTHLREFQAEYPHGPGEPPRVNVRIQARLVRLPRRTQVASTSIQAVVPANGRSTEAVVIAFDEAFGRATKDLVAWALERIAAHQATSSAI